jgi:hypothetical protein
MINVLSIMIAIALLLEQPTSVKLVTACNRCGWTPPAGPSVTVSSVEALESAVSRAREGDTILLADGDYRLVRMIDITTPGLTIRGLSGDPARVVLRGGGMTNDTVGVALSISATDVTIADVTVRDVGYHAVQVRGELGASGFMLHNAILRDTGQQLLKGSVAQNGRRADRGLVACSDFSYTDTAPSNYTNGVDILRTIGWVIRDNRFLRIRGPRSERFGAGPAVLAWKGAEDTVVMRNVVMDSFRGIAFGLEPDGRPYGPAEYDHRGGVIRDNTVINLNAWADEAIEANGARDALIERNTVVVEGSVPWSIGVRFPTARAVVTGNITTRQVLERDGGQAIVDNHTTVGANPR